MSEPNYGSLEHIQAVEEERQAAWGDLLAICRKLGIEVNRYSTKETLAWRIGAHLLRTVRDIQLTLDRNPTLA